ncbi:hypothetical protein F2Q70_00025914 [Brassica cretica]|uniref:Uncharacterized protein n=1 Tax=Brassica cretica TaxID=69181 RepID=A0A8S9L586_BRACR|nr:hypothetical protein F2Q70_00025914 [Brassica cretica]
MIQESLQLATVEWNTRQNTRRRSKLTLQHRSTVDIRNRPTHHMKNRRDDADYEEERATEYKAILDEEDTLLHHSSWKRNTPSIDMTSSPSIDTQPHQINWKRASTDIANYSSIDAEVDRMYEPGEDELHEGFTYEELLNMQRHDETDQLRSEAASSAAQANALRFFLRQAMSSVFSGSRRLAPISTHRSGEDSSRQIEITGSQVDNIGRTSGVDQHSRYIDVLDRQLDEKEMIVGFGLIGRCPVLERNDIVSCWSGHPVSFIV